MTRTSKPGIRAERRHATASPRTQSGGGWSTFAGVIVCDVLVIYALVVRDEE